MGYQFKRELSDLILKRKKWQTRRPFRAGDILLSGPSRIIRVTKNGKARLQWQVGKTYAIQPGRGKKAVGYFTLTDLRFEDVRRITAEDAIAEGFDSVPAFLAVWVGFYDRAVTITRLEDGQWHMTFKTVAKITQDSGVTVRVGKMMEEFTGDAQFIRESLWKRPAGPYMAWAHTFALVDVAEMDVAS